MLFVGYFSHQLASAFELYRCPAFIALSVAAAFQHNATDAEQEAPDFNGI